MKKYLHFLFTALLSLSVVSAYADQPKQLTVFQTSTVMIGLDEEIYPIGWAKEGTRLAVLVAYPDEASDERPWHVQLIDLVTDKLILDEEIRNLDEGKIATFWAARGEKVMELLKPFDVIPAKFELHPFPALLGKFRRDPYEVSLKREDAKQNDFEYTGIKKLEVYLTNGNRKTKKVFSKTWPEYYALGAGVLGYLPNPQGDRIAIILATSHRGWEGPPNVRSLTIFGARIGEKF